MKITRGECKEVIKNCKFAKVCKSENISFCAAISNPVYSDASPGEFIWNAVKTLLSPFSFCTPMKLIHIINYPKNNVDNDQEKKKHAALC